MIQVTSTAEGVVIPVRAQPGARKNGIAGVHDGALKVAVTAPPDKGKANEAIIEVLAEAFDLAKSAIVLHSGPTSRQKKFLLHGVTELEVARVLEQLLAS